MRKTGIELFGEKPWGTHFCQFYQNKEDLIDILIPYLKAGLENNEYCIWVTSEPLDEKDAKKALTNAIPNFNQYLQKEQIEIFPHEKWYTKEGSFDWQRVLNAWLAKLDGALSRGYDGMRVTGNTAWLEENDWKAFCDYEAEINNSIKDLHILSLCSFSLDKCEIAEIINVINYHEFALIKTEGVWSVIENPERMVKKDALKTRDKMKNLNIYLQTKRELEKKSIATELYEGITQELVALKINLALLGEDLPEDQTEPLRKIREMQEHIDNTCYNAQRLAVEMRPSILNHLGLIAVIRWEAKEFQNRTGVICDIVLEKKEISLDWERTTALFRIFQELMLNVEKHSDATRVMASLCEKRWYIGAYGYGQWKGNYKRADQ